MTLHLAAKLGLRKEVAALLSRGTDVNARGINGMTALHMASIGSHAQIASELLAAGATIDARDDWRRTPLSHAKRYDVGVVLLAAGAKVDALSQSNWTPLHAATHECADLKLIELLLDAGADVDAINELGQTPLHLAARISNINIVRLLLKRGANVKLATKQKWTPLHVAAVNNRFDVAVVLLDAGAEIDTRNDADQTPLSLAAASAGTHQLVAMLLERGATVDVTMSTTKWTPLISAVELVFFSRVFSGYFNH